MAFFHNIWAKEKGDFNPSQDQDSWLNLINTYRRNVGLKLIFAPRCAFTNRIVSLGEDNQVLEDFFIRTRCPADGGIVDGPGEAVMIFNADCPIVAVHDKTRERLAVLHAGFRCLVPSGLDRTRTDHRSIIQVLFDDHGFSPSAVDVFVGYGIGPCCYGAEHWPEVSSVMADIPVGRATRGPRSKKAEKSIDLYRLIQKQLVKAGVPEHKIDIDYGCTACAAEWGSPVYHSNCWDGKMAGRNASFAWFVR